jgi:hypothetical protein
MPGSRGAVDTRVGFGSQNAFHFGRSFKLSWPDSDLPLFVFFQLNTFCLRSDLQLFCSVRFRSHSLLPRDMAGTAFVSSTGDVEE